MSLPFVRLLVALAGTTVASEAGLVTHPSFRVDSRNPTADKPQSKLWHAQGTWWALLPAAAGPSLWGRGPAGWREQENVRRTLAGRPGRCDVWFDQEGATAVGLGADSLAVYRFTPGKKAAAGWEVQELAAWPVSTTVPLETVTIARDETGRWWVAAPVTPPGAISVASKTNHKVQPSRVVQVWYSGDARAWTALPPLATGIGGDDICMITALAGGVGVAWSDQNRDEVAFRLHRNDRAPEAWEAVERIASGGKTADDHLHAAVAGGKLWLATKNSVDTVGQPQLVLRVRSADGTWRNFPYAPKQAGRDPSRPIVVADPSGKKLILAQSDYLGKGKGDRISWGMLGVDDPLVTLVLTPAIEPDPASHVRVNDVTGPKGAFPASGPRLLLASDEQGGVYEVDVRPLTGAP